jgi:hypothetical protein
MLNPLIFFGFFLSGLNDILRPFGLHFLPLEQMWQLVFTGYCGALMVKRKTVNRSIMTVMLACMAISLISGMLNNQISTYSLQALYAFLMPILTFSAGVALRTRFGNEFEPRMLSVFKALFWALLIQGILYLSFTAMGMIHRVGNSIPFIVPIIYLMAYSSSHYLWLSPLAVIFSGKRIVLLFILILGSVLVLRNARVAMKYAVPAIVLGVATTVSTMDFLVNYLRRWNIELLIDLIFVATLDVEIIDQFSSGRLGQWIGGLNAIDTPFKFFFGSGSGTTISYAYTYLAEEQNESSWFVHNAFITYYVQFGLVGTILLVGLLTKILFRGSRARGASFAFYYFLLCLTTTIFSANIVVNPLFWFFAGTLYKAGMSPLCQSVQQIRMPAAVRSATMA